MKKKKLVRRIIILVLILALALALVRSNTVLQVEEFVIVFDELPKSFDGFRIVQISDLHGKEFGDGNSLLLEAVTLADPDIIVITGDHAADEEHYPVALALAGSLAKLAPTYYVAGNHEWTLDDPRDFFMRMAEAGVTVMENDYVLLELGGEHIVLAGIGDPNGPYDQTDPADFMQSLPEGFNVVLYHRNDALEELAGLGADLILSGHAHGGVVRLPFLGGLIDSTRKLFPDYTGGVYESESADGKMVVSRGLGNNRHTLRLFNNPQVPVIILSQK